MKSSYKISFKKKKSSKKIKQQTVLPLIDYNTINNGMHNS